MPHEELRETATTASSSRPSAARTSARCAICSDHSESIQHGATAAAPWRRSSYRAAGRETGYKRCADAYGRATPLERRRIQYQIAVSR